MFFAENDVGLPKLLERLKVYAAEAKQRYTSNKHYLPVDYFEPSQLLIDCVQAEQMGMKAKVPPGVPMVDAVLSFKKKGDNAAALSKLGAVVDHLCRGCGAAPRVRGSRGCS